MSVTMQRCRANSSARVRRNNSFKVQTLIFFSFGFGRDHRGHLAKAPSAEGRGPHRVRPERRGGVRSTCGTRADARRLGTEEGSSEVEGAGKRFESFGPT